MNTVTIDLDLFDDMRDKINKQNTRLLKIESALKWAMQKSIEKLLEEHSDYIISRAEDEIRRKIFP